MNKTILRPGYAPNPEEYISLRTEMIARIQAINSQSSSAITAILTAWASAIALLILSFNEQVSDVNVVVGFDIAQSLTLFIPVLFLLPVAVKSGENLCQIVSISCYIRVFFEHQESNDIFYSWESANNSISSVNVDRKEFSLAKLYNLEYPALSIASIVMMVAFSYINYNRITTTILYPIYLKLFHIAVVLFGLICTGLITCATSVKTNMQDNAVKYIAGYVLYGKKKQLLIDMRDSGELIRQIIDESYLIDEELKTFVRTYNKRGRR